MSLRPWKGFEGATKNRTHAVSVLQVVQVIDGRFVALNRLLMFLSLEPPIAPLALAHPATGRVIEPLPQAERVEGRRRGKEQPRSGIKRKREYLTSGKGGEIPHRGEMTPPKRGKTRVTL